MDGVLEIVLESTRDRLGEERRLVKEIRQPWPTYQEFLAKFATLKVAEMQETILELRRSVTDHKRALAVTSEEAVSSHIKQLDSVKCSLKKAKDDRTPRVHSLDDSGKVLQRLRQCKQDLMASIRDWKRKDNELTLWLLKSTIMVLPRDEGSPKDLEPQNKMGWNEFLKMLRNLHSESEPDLYLKRIRGYFSDAFIALQEASNLWNGSRDQNLFQMLLKATDHLRACAVKRCAVRGTSTGYESNRFSGFPVSSKISMEPFRIVPSSRKFSLSESPPALSTAKLQRQIEKAFPSSTLRHQRGKGDDGNEVDWRPLFTNFQPQVSQKDNLDSSLKQSPRNINLWRSQSTADDREEIEPRQVILKDSGKPSTTGYQNHPTAKTENRWIASGEGSSCFKPKSLPCWSSSSSEEILGTLSSVTAATTRATEKTMDDALIDEMIWNLRDVLSPTDKPPKQKRRYDD
ncbi:unnamed protein product [Cyprideis torosa]|uniref:Uncharacterized protein n=1 Tax=Cyprideis torosa TaxID=163714 RepID=A0A7R8WFR2_9CRUS|nr:unnamed protein product [Cyprideis torosa]CAG0897332.1 unnamed protein product [Cyprideis torosa]